MGGLAASGTILDALRRDGSLCTGGLVSLVLLDDFNRWLTSCLYARHSSDAFQSIRQRLTPCSISANNNRHQIE